MNTYFAPGCDVKMYRKEESKKILDFLVAHEGCKHTIPPCCRVEQQFGENPTVIVACPGCQRRFTEEHSGITTISLWEVLDQSKVFPIPNHRGKEFTIHDPCLMIEHPEVHRAVRSLIEKMGISIVEPKKTATTTECCGGEDNREQLKARISGLPEQQVIVYCMGCYESMKLGNKPTVYLLDLLLERDV